MNIKKLQNFLYYNWIKIAAVAFVLIFTVVTLRQCANKHETDLGIMYAGPEAVSDKLALLREEIELNTDLEDIDSDGIITAREKSITIPKSKEHTIEQQVMEQIQVEIIAGDYLVYIITEPVFMKYAIDDSFMDIGELAPDSLRPENGEAVYSLPLEGNALFEKFDIPTEGMYIALRACPEGKKNSPEYSNAIAAFKYIMNGGN